MLSRVMLFYAMLHDVYVGGPICTHLCVAKCMCRCVYQGVPGQSSNNNTKMRVTKEISP